VWVNPMEYKRVGRVLAAARLEKNISQEVLAARLSKPQSFVSSYENGQRRIDVLELIRICRELRANPVEIFKGISSGLAPPRAKRG
jgi:transcriptional regulator with XRE-family HTH domain